MKQLLLDKPGSAENAREYAYRTLKNNILGLVLLPGDRMSEAAAADALGASRTPVHDAFARLAEEGLLCVAPQKGTVVSGIDADRVRQTVFMRTQLGCAVVASLCAQGNLSEELLFSAQANVNRQYFLLGASNLAELAQAGEAFHAMLFEACGYGLVWRTLESVSGDVHRVCSLMREDGSFAASRVQEFAGILDALQRRSAAALCAQMRAHLARPAALLPQVMKRDPALFYTLQDSRRRLLEES